VPSIERPANSLGEGRPIEFEVARQMVQIEEVLDAAVAVAEDDHGLELLCNDGLARVGQNPG